MLPGIKQPPIKFGDLMVYLTVAIKHIRLMVLLLAFSVLCGLTLYVYSRPVYYARTIIERKEVPLPVNTETVHGDSTVQKVLYQFSSSHLTERTAKRFYGIDMPDKFIRRKYLKKTGFRLNSQGNIEVEVWAFTREMAETWSKNLLEEYLNYRTEQRQARRDLVMNDFTKEMERVSKKMEEWLNSNYAYQDSNKMAQVTLQLKEMQAVPIELAQVNYNLEQLRQLKDRLSKSDLKIIEKLSLIRSYSSMLEMKVGDVFSRTEGTFAPMQEISPAGIRNAPRSQEVVIVPQMVEGGGGQSTWTESEKEFRKLAQERVALSQKYLPAHPKLKTVDDRIKELEAVLNTELQAGLSQVDLRIGELASRQKTLNAKLPDYLEAQKQDAKLKLGYDQMAAGQLAWRGFYDYLAKAVNLLEFGDDKEKMYLTYGGSLEERLDVPLSPNRLNLVLYSFALGLVLAVLVPFLLEYLDHTIGTVEVGEDTLRLRALGVVPQLKENSSQPVLLGEPDATTMMENFRVIRTNLLFNVEGQNDARVIMIASAMPQEGKTYVARNIAISFARKGEKTLLIDADIRRGTVHQAFNVSSSPGLAEVIMGSAELSQVARESNIHNLQVIPRGKFSEEVTDRFGDAKFGQIIQELRGKYDRIIIDTPPVLGLAETSSLLQYVDGVAFVVWSGRTPLRNVRIAIDTLRSNGAKFYGFVLNRLDLTATSNYYYYYYYSHNYYETYHPAERSQG